MSEQIETFEIGGVKFLTADGVAQIVVEGQVIDLDTDALGGIAGFLAEAWFNLEGEDYEQGLEHFLRSIAHPLPERDCE